MRALVQNPLPVVLVLGTLGGTACDINDFIPEEARTFTVPAESEVTVPGAQIVGQNPLGPEQVLPGNFGDLLSQQLGQTFSTEGVDKDAVESATLTSMRVTVVDAEQNGRQVRDLGFLNSLSFSLGGGDLEPVLVAFSEEGAFADDPIVYDFELTEAELVDFVQNADALEMTGDVETNGAPALPTTLRFEVEMTVVADVAGALN